MLVEVQARPGAPKPAANPAINNTSVRTPAPHAAGGPDRASTLSNQLLDGRYQISKKLGEGGMS